MRTRLPRTGDLIYIKRAVSGVITQGSPVETSNWHMSLTTIEPNHTAIVLKSYRPDFNDTTTQLLEDPNPGDEKKLTVMVIAIGELIIETIYSPDYMDVISSNN